MLIRALLVTLTVISVASAIACGDNSSPTAASGLTATATIPVGAASLTTTAFGANPLVITSGTTVTWVNGDNVTHTSNADLGAWSSGGIAPGASFNRTFSSTGTFSYHCSIHPGMVGTIVVNAAITN